MSEKSEIAQFYDGQSVFITGATGFLGKAVVEKLLRCCPSIDKIYILVRPKRGVASAARLESIVNCPLFDKLKAEKPSILNKVKIINGDITLPNLGISPEDDEILCENVSVVIHSAATVKFDEPLKKSIEINVEGTRKVIDLAKRMQHIKAVVHVSTAYSNCDRSEISEEIYPINMDPNHAIDAFKWLPEKLIDDITPKLIEGKPNTYTYTKHLAEQLVTQCKDEVPICIVRPSIVAATYEDPIPGWVDNWNGPTGIFIGCGKGFLRTLLLHTDQKLDIIPLDHVVSLIIAAAWRTGTAHERKEETQLVYHCCSGADNPFFLTQAIPWCFDAFWNTPFSEVLWYPGPIVTTSLMMNRIMDRLFHYIPCQLVDLKARLCGDKAVMMRIYAKAQAGVLALRYFCTNEWSFSTENANNLYLMLNATDQKLFKFDIKSVNWEKYIHSYVYGMRKYVLKEPDESIPQAIKSLKKMHYVHRGTIVFIYFLLAIFLFYFVTFAIRLTA